LKEEICRGIEDEIEP